MSNLWVNIRFGTRHLQIENDFFAPIRFSVNDYYVRNKPAKWFKCYDFFGLV